MSETGPATSATSARPAAPSVVRAGVVYTGLRLGLFAGLAVVLVLAGVGLFPALLGGLLGSAVASLVLLRPQRDELATALVARRQQAGLRRAHEARVREHVERVRGGQVTPPPA